MRAAYGRVSPLDREHVIRADAWYEIFRKDLVLRLRDVVKTRVIHQARRVPHAMNPGRAAHAVGRVRRAGFHVVLKAERVPNFVRDNVFEQSAHQRIGERQMLRARIEWRDLSEIPVAREVENVVMNANGAVQDLATSRVVHVWPIGVLSRGGQPAYHRIANVFR